MVSVSMCDLDWDDNGTVSYITSDDHFLVATDDGKDGTLRAAR